MSACSLQQIFENSLPENPKLLESLSWKPIQHSSSFTEIFGELYFNESPAQSPSSSSSPHVCSSSFSEIINHANLVQNEEALVVSLPGDNIINQTPSSLPCISTTRANSSNKLRSDSSSSLSSDQSLNICTESLGFESSDEVEELKINETNNEQQGEEEEEEEEEDSTSGGKLLWKSRSLLREYPPPISCIGRSGKPCVSFKSYRNNGRFVLKEIRIPTRDFLHAHREDGRLTLHFVQPTEEDEFLGGEDQEEEEEEDYDGVESTEEDEEENHGSATDQVNEEKKD